MKITTVTISCRKTVNYQSFECTLTAELTDGDDRDMNIKILQARARKHVMDQIDIEKGRKLC